MWCNTAQTPPDLVVKFQCIDIADVIVWPVFQPPGMSPREIKGGAALPLLKPLVYHLIRWNVGIWGFLHNAQKGIFHSSGVKHLRFRRVVSL
jgi:hypothetical protein